LQKRIIVNGVSAPLIIVKIKDEKIWNLSVIQIRKEDEEYYRPL
jgi:hypothetical protein